MSGCELSSKMVGSGNRSAGQGGSAPPEETRPTGSEAAVPPRVLPVIRAQKKERYVYRQEK